MIVPVGHTGIFFFITVSDPTNSKKKGLLTLLTQLHKIMLCSSLYEIRMLDEEEDPLVVE